MLRLLRWADGGERCGSVEEGGQPPPHCPGASIQARLIALPAAPSVLLAEACEEEGGSPLGLTMASPRVLHHRQRAREGDEEEVANRVDDEACHGQACHGHRRQKRPRWGAAAALGEAGGGRRRCQSALEQKGMPSS